jgi:exopolysaccharide production protein ExoZ
LLLPRDGIENLSRPIYFGLPAALIVFGAAHIAPVVDSKIPGWMIFLGNSSYSLYLVHPLIGPAAPAILQRLGVHSAELSVLLSIAISVLAGVVSYKLFELPVNEFLKRRHPKRSLGPK